MGKQARRERAAGKHATDWKLIGSGIGRPTDRQGKFRIGGGKMKRELRTKGMVLDTQHCTLGTKDTLGEQASWIKSVGGSEYELLHQNGTGSDLYHADRANRAWDILYWFVGCPTLLDSLRISARPIGDKKANRADRFARDYVREAKKMAKLDAKAQKQSSFRNAMRLRDPVLQFLAMIEGEMKGPLRKPAQKVGTMRLISKS